jgi:ketosteroid isomerase-like protein
MSQENLEIMRKMLGAINRGDRDAWLALHDPDVEFRADPDWPESETVRGRAAVWDFAANLTEAWEPDDFEEVEVIDAGPDKLVARLRRPVRGRTSGLADVLDYWCVFTLRLGKIRSILWFASRAKALDAAGPLD